MSLLLLLYLLTAFAYAALAPLTTGPDELAHYEYVRFIADHGRLPINSEERQQASYKSDQPPLYHLLAALPAALVDPAGPPYLKRVSDHPRRQLIERTRHAWGLYNTEDEHWPYRAEILRWHTGRWVAILLGAATVAVTFFIARDVFSSTSPRGDAWLPVLAAAIVAFTPRFGLTGAMLNYETTLAFFAALFLWILLRLANFAAAPSPKLPLLLGFFAGLAIVTKLSALILLPELVLAFWLIGRSTRGFWWRGALTALITALAVMSLWFGFVLFYFNTIAEDGVWIGLLRPLVAADASDATTNQLLSFLTGGQAGFTGAIENLESGPPWDWARIFFRTFWQVGIEHVQPWGQFGPVVALALCLLAAYGLSQINRKSKPNDYDAPPGSPYINTQLILSLLALHLFLPLVLPLLRYAVTFSLADTAQGRHVLFSAAPAFAVLMVWGLQRAAGQQESAPPQGRRPGGYAWLLAFLPAPFLLVWTAAHLWAMTWAYLPPLPVSTLAEAKRQASHSLDKPLNEFVSLVGYHSQIDPQRRQLRLDLIWQAAALSPVDYLTEVSLLDAQQTLQAQWLGYTASGRYPTRAWDVGDVVRDTVWLPIEGLAPGPYQLSLRLIPARYLDSPETDVAPLTLTDLTLPDTALRTFNSSLAFTDQALAAAGYSVWQNGQALTSPQEFRYRETVLITLSPLLPNQQRTIRLVGPDKTQSFAPVRQLNNTALFIVGPDWPGGDYRLQISVTSPTADEQQVESSVILTVVDRWQRQFTLSPAPEGYVQLEANFADQVKLLGYQLGANRAEPGGGIPLTLYWQALEWLGSDYTIFTKLLAADGVVHGGRDRLPREGYRTIYWAPGEIVSDPLGVPVAADAPPGVYHLNLGLYQQIGQQAVSLPLVQDGQLVDASSITIGPIKIGGPPAGATVNEARPQTALQQPFGDPTRLTLLGYDLSPDNCQQGAAACQWSMTLYWRCEAPLSLDYTTFVHLRNEAGETVAQQDQPPLQGLYPTSLWDPGEIIADTITLSLPENLPPGEYQWVIGLYDFYTGQRLAVPGIPANEFLLLSLTR